MLSVIKLKLYIIVDMWDLRKLKLYGNDSCPSQFQSQSSAGNLGVMVGNRVTCKFVGKNVHYTCVNNVFAINNGSACCYGCVVYGSDPIADC